jgi:hypothetical protein
MVAGVLGVHGHHVVSMEEPQVEESAIILYLRMEALAALEMK